MSTENTEGINGDYAALNKSTADEFGKPSSVAKNMGASAPVAASTEEPVPESTLPDLQMPTGFKLLEDDRVFEPVEDKPTPSSTPSSPKSIAAKIHNNIQRVIDGDTIVFQGRRVRLFGVDAPESRQEFGSEALAWLTDTLGNANSVSVINKGTDVYGRQLGKVYADGVDVGKEMVKRGWAVPSGGDQDEDSAELFYAGERARESKLGMWANGGGASTTPAVFRRFDTPWDRYARDEFTEAMNQIRKRVRKLTPEEEEQFFNGLLERTRKADAALSEDDKRAAGVLCLSDTVMHLAAIGNRYKNRNLDVDDIPVRELEEALRAVCESFGYKPEDFVKEGYDSPYDAIRELIKGSMGIADRVARRQKALQNMSTGELQDEANKAVFGDDVSKYRTWSYRELEAYTKMASLEQTLRTAFLNGAKGSTVATAVMMAMEEFEDAGAHRVRLSQLPADQIYKAYEITQAIRGEYNESWWGKFFISLANGAEAVYDNVIHTLFADNMGNPDAAYKLDVLSQGIEDTIIDTSTWGGEIASVVGGSIPYMLLFMNPYTVAFAFISAYGEAAKIPVEEGWTDYDRDAMEMFKVGYGIMSPLIELGAIGVALKPVSMLGKFGLETIGKRGAAKLAGFFSTKTLAMKLAGAESKSVLSKVWHGLTLSAHRSLISAPGEVVEEVADEALRSGIGLILDPTDEYGRKLYNIERFSDNVINTAITAIKTVPFMTMGLAGLGTIKEAGVLKHQLKYQKAAVLLSDFAAGKEINPLEAEQQAVNEVAAWDARTRAETLGGLSKEEVAEFYSADAKKRAEILEKTEDSSKKKWLSEIDTYLGYNETIKNRSGANANANTGAGAGANTTGPVVKNPKGDAGAEFRRIENETRGQEGSTDGGKPDANTAENADTKNPPKQGDAGETKDKKPGAATTADAGNVKPVPVVSNEKVPVKQEQAGTGTGAGAGTGAKPAATTEGAKPKGGRRSAGTPKVPTDNKKAGHRARRAEKILGEVANRRKNPKKAKKDAGADANKPQETTNAPESSTKPVPSRPQTKKEFDKNYKPDPKKYEIHYGPEGGDKASGRRKGRPMGVPEKVPQFRLNDIVRPLSPEIDAALEGKVPKGGVTEDGTILNPRMIEIFKGAIEESEKTGVGIMDIFAVQYARKLAKAVADPDAHQDFLNDPFSWAESMVEQLVRLSRAAKAGNAKAIDMLERAYVDRKTAEESRRAREKSGRVDAHKNLVAFATFARKWLRSVFGENADIYFIEDLTGETAEQREVLDAIEKVGANRVNALIITASGNVYVSKNANPVKVLHEVFGHGTWEWMKKNDPKGYEKLKELARNAPEEVKARVKKNYKNIDENSDEFLNEVFAHLIEAKYSGRVGAMFNTHASRSWFGEMWDAFVSAIKRAWRALTGADMDVSPEEFLDELSERFFGYKGIFIGEEASGSGVKFSVDEDAEVVDNEGDNASKENEKDDQDNENPELDKVTTAQLLAEWAFLANADLDGNAVDDTVAGRGYESGFFISKSDMDRLSSADTSAALPTFVSPENTGNLLDTRDTWAGYYTVVDNFLKSLGLSSAELNDPREFRQTSDEEALTRANWIKSYIEERLSDDGLKPSDLSEEEKRQLLAEARSAWDERGEDAAVKPTKGSLGADALEAWIESKTGVERAVAEAVFDIIRMLSADPAYSKVSLTEADLAMVRKAVETVRGLADTQDGRTKLGKSLAKQADALEQLEAMFVRNTGEFQALKQEISRFIAVLRPTAEIIGAAGDTTVLRDDLNTFETPGGKELKGAARILALNIFDEIQENNVRLKNVVRLIDGIGTLIANFKDKYAWSHQNPYVSASADEIIDIYRRAFGAAEAELGFKKGELLKEVERQKANNAVYGRANAKESIEESKKAANERTITARAEKLVKRIQSKFSIVGIVELLSQDDAARAGEVRFGEPMSEELRKRLEEKLEEYLSPGVESKSRRMSGEDWEFYKRCAREFYAGYKAAKARGEIYADTKAYTDFRAAFKAVCDAYALQFNRMIPKAKADSIIAKAEARYEAAKNAYIDEMRRTKQRSPSHIIKSIHKAFGSEVAESTKVKKYEAGDKRLQNRKPYTPIEEISDKELAANVWKDYASLREWVSRRLGERGTAAEEDWVSSHVESYKKYVDSLRDPNDAGAAVDLNKLRKATEPGVVEKVAAGNAAVANALNIDAKEKFDEIKKFVPVYKSTEDGKVEKQKVVQADGTVKEEPVILHYVRKTSVLNENIEAEANEAVFEDEDGQWEYIDEDEYVPDVLPSGLRRAWREEQLKAEDEGRAPRDFNDVAWEWLTKTNKQKGAADVGDLKELNIDPADLGIRPEDLIDEVKRSWIGILTKLTPARYKAIKKSIARQVATAVELERQAAQAYEMRRQVSATINEEVSKAEAGKKRGQEQSNDVPSGSFDGVHFSLEGDAETSGDADGDTGGKPTPAEEHRNRSTHRAMDLAVMFLMRMLSSGRTELTEDECLAMAERYDPYLGGEELRCAIAAARLLAGICREAPGIEKLDDSGLVDLVTNTFENLTHDQFMQLVELLNTVQTDEWKSIAQAYRDRLDRFRRTGRMSEGGAMTPQELRDLGVPMSGRSAEASGTDVFEDQELRPKVNSYDGLARKLFNHIFGTEGAPKRSDYKSDEEFEKAERAHYFKTLESATPEKIAKFRDTLVWLYGKYSTDGFLRKFFRPNVAKVVRRMVQHLKYYADTPIEILNLAERIESELRTGRQAVSPRTTMEQIRSLVEAYARKLDPRKALKDRKISPQAQAFFNAFNEALVLTDDAELKKKIGDVDKMTPRQISKKIHELRQQIKEQLNKKKKEAAEEFGSENERESSGTAEEIKGNAVKALESYYKQLGYSLALQYIEAKEKLDSSQKTKKSADDVAKLEDEFAHVYDTLVGVAARGREEVQSHVLAQMKEVEIFISKIKALLDVEKTKNVDKTGSSHGLLHDILRKAGDYVVSGFSLKQRLEELARFSDAKEQAQLRELFDEFINNRVALAETNRNQYYHDARVAFSKMFAKIYGDGKTEIDDVGAILEVLNTPLEELAKFSANGKTKLTRSQAMAQLAMLSQEDVQRPILELKRKLEAGEILDKDLTEEQRTMLRRMELMPELAKTLDELSGGKDLQMIDALVKYYADMAPMLDAVAEKITGMPVSVDAARYFPVRRSKDYAARKIDRTGRVLGAVPDFLSPRMEITTDIAETADIFSIFIDQAEKQSHFLAFGELHYRMTALFENSDWSHLLNKYLGEEDARLLKEHVQDICSPNLIFVDNGGENAAIGMLRNATSILMLGGNVQSAIKQPLSLPALAHEVGWWKLIKAVLRNPWSKECHEIRKMLYNTGDGKLRWGDMFVGVQDSIMKRPGKKSWVSKLFAWYMALQRWGDWLPFFFAGPGLYVANYNMLRSRINSETGRPYTHEEAQELAKAMLFDHIEKTQQTNRISNLGHVQRRSDNLGKVFTQFASSPMLFFAAEARAVRDVLANPKNKENWKKLGGIVMSNHVVMPSLLKGAEIMFQWLFKDDEPDEEDFKSWLKLMASGPLSGLIFLGMIFTNDRPGGGDVAAPVASGVNRFAYRFGKVIGDLFEGEWEKAGDDAIKFSTTLIPLWRDIYNIITNRIMTDDKD